MTDHAWSQEQIAAHVAGGLDAAEAERLEQHARDCPDCAAALSAARRLDRGLGELFAGVRPGPALEDRAVVSLRAGRKRRGPLMAGWARRATVAIAALLLLGTFGALAGSLLNDGLLPMPGGGNVALGPRITREAIAQAQPTPDSAPLMQDQLRSYTFKSLESTTAQDDKTSAQAPKPGGESSGGERAGAFSNGYVSPPGRPPQGGAGFGGGGIGGFGGGFGGGFQGGGGSPGMPGGGATFAAPPQGYNGIGVRSVPAVTGTPGGGMPGGPMFAAPGVPGGAAQPKESVAAADSVFEPIHQPNGRQSGMVADGAKFALRYFQPGTSRPVTDDREAQPGRDKSEPSQSGQGQGKKDEQAGGQPKPDDAQKPGEKAAQVQPPAKDPPPQASRRIVIRSGDMEFEVNSFDAAVATVTKLVTAINGAFVATVNSEKLPNGKVKGAITVRTPPEHLDALVLDLRKELGQQGEIKGVRIGSQDVTKHYTDLESRLKAARTMEERLIQIIKEGKGEIKQLLEAERELGTWRTKIEEFEGEIRYMGNLASLSTLTVTLAEKEIRTAVGVTESERVQAGVEVEDVDKAFQTVLTAVLEAKGRVTKSELKQLAAGQFNATLHFELAPEAAGPMRDRLRQLGKVARLEIDRVQQAEGGTVPRDAKVKRGDTAFLVQLYNLANIAPRETTTMQVAVPAVPAAYATLREAVEKAKGRVLNAQLSEQDPQNVTAQLDFDVRRTDEGAVRAALEAAGDVASRQVTRAPESDSVTDTKVLYRVTLLSASRIQPRETATMQVAAADVPAAYNSMRDAVEKAKGRVVTAQLNEQDRKDITAQLDFEVRRAEEPAVRAALEAVGEVGSRQVARAPEASGVSDAKVLYRVSLLSASRLGPREVTTLAVEVANVDQTTAVFAAQVGEAKGRQLDAKSERDRNGRVTAHLVYEVPLAVAGSIVEQFKQSGKVRAYQSIRDPQAVDGRFATARIDVTISNEEQIVAADDGLWPQVRKGLSYSASVLLTSVTWVVFGLCVVLPWAVVAFVGYRLLRWLFRTRPAPVPVTTA